MTNLIEVRSAQPPQIRIQSFPGFQRSWENITVPVMLKDSKPVTQMYGTGTYLLQYPHFLNSLHFFLLWIRIHVGSYSLSYRIRLRIPITDQDLEKSST